MKKTFQILSTIACLLLITLAIYTYIRINSTNPTINAISPDKGQWIPLEVGKLYQQSIPLLRHAEHVDILIQTEAPSFGNVEIKINNGTQTVSTKLSGQQIINNPLTTITLPPMFVASSQTLTISLIPDVNDVFKINTIPKNTLPSYLGSQVVSTIDANQFIQMRTANKNNDEIKLLDQLTWSSFFDWTSNVLSLQRPSWQQQLITQGFFLMAVLLTLILKTALRDTKLTYTQFALTLVGILVLSIIV